MKKEPESSSFFTKHFALLLFKIKRRSWGVNFQVIHYYLMEDLDKIET